MATWRPDPTFYPSASLAMQAPAERLGYLAILDVVGNRPDAPGVVDLDPQSSTYGQLIGRTLMPNAGDELHHFGWNACSSALCPYAPHPHVERRYLIVPGLRSSRIHVLDTKPDPRSPKIVKVIEPAEVHKRAGYSRPHTLHCGPEGIYLSALGASDGGGPGGLFVLDHDSFDVLGRWEIDRGPQFLAYDFAWHLGHDIQVTSEWGTPKMIEDGIVPELLLGSKYGHQLHVWDLRKRKHLQATGSIRVGGIVRRSPHPAAGPLNGGPQMVEVSRDGRRIYVTNGLYRAWDAQFYPEGIQGWLIKADASPEAGLELDPDFFLPSEKGYRSHQIRLEGGDSSSDTFCYP